MISQSNISQKPLPTYALYLLYGLATLSVVGYGTFGLHPQWLAQIPGTLGRWVMSFYNISFRVFGEYQTWLICFVLFWYLSVKTKGRWILPGIVIAGIGLLSELGGTIYGIPFGSYRYTQLMGYKIFGHVPTVIVVSWFMMTVPAYGLALWLFPRKTQWVWRIVGGATLLTLWDLSLDPAMSYLTPYWQWTPKGSFYDMPLQNWVGWFLTGLVIMAAMHVMRSERWLKDLSPEWIFRFYCVNLAIPFGMLVAAGLWPVVGLNLLAFGLCGGVWWFARPTHAPNKTSTERPSLSYASQHK